MMNAKHNNVRDILIGDTPNKNDVLTRGLILVLTLAFFLLKPLSLYYRRRLPQSRPVYDFFFVWNLVPGIISISLRSRMWF